MTNSRFGIATVREAVRKRVAETSLRHVADEIGMSFSGLRSFLRGGAPHRETGAKLVSWYAGLHRKAATVPREEVETAVALLVQYIRSGSSETVRQRRLKEILKEINAAS